MANNELALQGEMVRDALSLGGHSFKMSHRFKAGIADLYVKMPGHPSCFIEVKWDPRLVMNNRAMAVGLTDLQRRFLRSSLKAGGCAGWALGCRISKSTHALVIGTDTNVKSVVWNQYEAYDMESDGTFDVMIRHRGEKWDMAAVCGVIEEGNESV